LSPDDALVCEQRFQESCRLGFGFEGARLEPRRKQTEFKRL